MIDGFKGTLTGLRQFLATGSPLKINTKCFLCYLKCSFCSWIFPFLFWIFGLVGKQLDNKAKIYFSVDTGRKLNVHKTFRSRPGRLLNVLCTFNLRPVSAGFKIYDITKQIYRQLLTIQILLNVSRSKDNQKKETSLVNSIYHEAFFLKNDTQYVVEKLVPKLFLKNQNSAYIWINSLKVWYCLLLLQVQIEDYLNYLYIK